MEYDVYYFGRSTPVRRHWPKLFTDSVAAMMARWGHEFHAVPVQTSTQQPPVDRGPDRG